MQLTRYHNWWQGFVDMARSTFGQLQEFQAKSDLVGALMAHFHAKLIVITESFHFYCHNQAVGEWLAQYIAELWRLANHCDFGEQLNDAYYKRLYCSSYYGTSH